MLNIYGCSIDTEFQLNLKTVQRWSRDNNLSPNIDKCKAFTFCRGKTYMDCEYELDNLVLRRTQVQKDSGVVFEGKFTLRKHLDYVLAKASKNLGFILRSTIRDFKNPLSLISLIKRLVLPILTYASSIWSPNTSYKYNYSEKIVHKALRDLRP